MNEEQLNAMQSEHEGERPNYVSQEELGELRDLIHGMLAGEGHGAPEPDDDEDDLYGRYLEDRITSRIAGMLEQALAPMVGQQALGHLARGIDPQVVSEYTDGLSPQELAFIAQHPGLSRAVREASHARSRGPISPVSALRNAESYDDDAPYDAAEERARRDALASIFGGDAVRSHFDRRSR